MFTGMVVLLIGGGVQTRRLQIWKQKLMQMGASIENHFSRKVTHVFAVDSDLLLKEVDRERLIRSKTKVLQYQWIESSLREGKAMPEDLYVITIESGGGNMQNFSAENRSYCDEQTSKKSRVSSDGVNVASLDHMTVTEHYSGSSCDSDIASNVLGPEVSCEVFLNHHDKDFLSDSSLLYKPPDLNKNVTEIFGKLINIYRALGDERRSFSYYKAILVIEKLPSKIENLDQVKHLPSIGKSMQDHILEIVNTRKLSKLEHFEKDEKVRTITLFGEVWGIGPATALKLYEKGNRTLDDLKNEESLTNAQRLGLKYFHDIKVRIPRHEVEEMEQLLKKAGEEILPGVMVLCAGSYRRGKASCGDMDIVITHPDGKSHISFLLKYVKRLKEMSFLREDLVFSVHSEEGLDSGVDTYFGLCTYPGRELRHRIDIKA